MKDFLLPEIGNISLDKILFEGSYPILFTCKADNGELFLCVCCQMNNVGIKWLIASTDSVTIIDILTNKITLRNSFLKGAKKFSFSLVEGVENVIVGDKDDWDAENSIFLPDFGEYMDATSDEFKDEINYYLEYKSFQYKSFFSQAFYEKNISISSDISFDIKSEFVDVKNSTLTSINSTYNNLTQAGESISLDFKNIQFFEVINDKPSIFAA